MKNQRLKEIFLKSKGTYEPRVKNLDKSLAQKNNWRKNRWKIHNGMKKSSRRRLLKVEPPGSIAKEIIDYLGDNSL